MITPDPLKEIAKIQDQLKNLEAEKKKDYEEICDTYLALAMAIRDAEDWIKSEEAAETSIKFAKKIKDKFIKNIKISNAYENIGSIYKIIQDYPKAIKFLNNAMSVLEENLTSLIKEKRKIEPEDFVKYSTLTKSLYADHLKQKIDILLTTNDEKKATESITKPFEKYLKTKDPDYIDNLTLLADVKIHLALKLKDNDQLIKGIGELIILDFFAKKFSDDEKYWSKKIHSDIKKNSALLVENLRIPPDEQILGKETLSILKQIDLETKDHMYIDKILELKRSEDFQKKIGDLKKIIENIKKEEASGIVLTMAENELITSLARTYDYNEAFQQAKEVIKEAKKIKNKIVKEFMLGAIQFNLFRVNVRKQDYKQAEKEIKKGIEYFEENLNTMVHACFGMLELASCYMIQDRLDKAVSTLERPIEICEQLGSPDFMARLYELLAGIRLKQGDYNGAAVDFSACAIFYLISDDNTKYQEFLSLAINLYNEFLKSLGFEGVAF